MTDPCADAATTSGAVTLPAWLALPAILSEYGRIVATIDEVAAGYLLVPSNELWWGYITMRRYLNVMFEAAPDLQDLYQEFEAIWIPETLDDFDATSMSVWQDGPPREAAYRLRGRLMARVVEVGKPLEFPAEVRANLEERAAQWEALIADYRKVKRATEARWMAKIEANAKAARQREALNGEPIAQPSPPKSKSPEVWSVITPVRDRTMVQMWHEGKDKGAIARQFGLTTKTVENRFTELRKVYGPVVVPYRRATVPNTARGYQPAPGDWINLLTAAGAIANETPVRVERLETGEDGELWLFVAGSNTGWRADRCEPAQPKP